MKIRDVTTRAVGGTGAVRPRRVAEGVTGAAAVAGAGDRVEVSARAGDVGRARRLALAAPDIRQDRVDAIVAEIQEGRYSVTGADVVPRLVEEHLALASIHASYTGGSART